MEGLDLHAVVNTAGLVALAVLLWWRTAQLEKRMDATEQSRTQLLEQIGDLKSSFAKVEGKLDMLLGIMQATPVRWNAWDGLERRTKTQ